MISRQKLAAIVFTDIVGYTTLMGSDEKSALEILRISRRIHTEAVEKYGGSLLKEMGDGMLIQFQTAGDAVNAALAIQEKAHLDLVAKIRIGIHIGDITMENDDVFGDGVNIASRIQSIADPGGIYLSESVKQAIRANPDYQYALVNRIRLKNVSDPIDIYYLKGDFLPVPSSKKIRELGSSSRKKSGVSLLVVVFLLVIFLGWWFNFYKDSQLPSLAVLPVANLTGNQENDIFMAGFHGELRSEIAKLKSMRIISRTSAARYKNAQMTLPEIGQELDINYILETDVYEYADSIKMQLRLISISPEEEEIWSSSYHIPSSYLIRTFDQVALAIAEETNIELSSSELASLDESALVDPEAQEAYLKGLDFLYTGTKPALEKAYEFFSKAVEIDDNYAKAYVGLAHSWGFRVQMGFISYEQAYPRFVAATQKANELDSTIIEAYYNEAISSVWSFWDWGRAEVAFKKTLEMDPTHAEALAYYAHFLNIMGRMDESEQHMQIALEYEPYNTWVQALYGMHLNHTRQFKKAEERLGEILKDESNPLASPALWTIYHNTGNYDMAIKAAQEVYSAKREYEVVAELLTGYRDGGYSEAMDRVASRFIQKKDSTFFPAWQIATLYTRADNRELALDWLWKAYEEHDVNMPYISCDPIFDKISQEERFVDLLNAMKLPVE